VCVYCEQVVNFVESSFEFQRKTVPPNLTLALYTDTDPNPNFNPNPNLNAHPDPNREYDFSLKIIEYRKLDGRCVVELRTMHRPSSKAGFHPTQRTQCKERKERNVMTSLLHRPITVANDDGVCRWHTVKL